MRINQRTKIIKRISIIIIIVLGLSITLIGGISFLNKLKSDEDQSKVSQEETISIQPEEKSKNEVSDEISNEVSNEASNDSLSKYMTISQQDEIDIIVNYLNPTLDSMDILEFDVSLGTHSVDLSKYQDITKFAELVTEDGIKISEGFEWELINAGGHHMNGILKIENNVNGTTIVQPDTKSFKLVFNNIGGSGKRNHVYDGDKLK